MTNKEWWQPANLEKQEELIRNVEQIESLEKGAHGGDFGSYKKVLITNNVQNTQLGMHNDLNSQNKISFINNLLPVNKRTVTHILDVGCGMGFTTHELGKFYQNATILGVDISHDAIAFAKKTFQTETFLQQAIEPTNSQLGNFDLIFCFEFYPFTRTNLEETHCEYLSYFFSQLNPGGSLILHQKWNQIDSINSENLSKLKQRFSEYKFDLKNIPHHKVIKYAKFKWISLFIDWSLRAILRKHHMKAIIISKKK